MLGAMARIAPCVAHHDAFNGHIFASIRYFLKLSWEDSVQNAGSIVAAIGLARFLAQIIASLNLLR
jgi:hypothetical protein